MTSKLPLRVTEHGLPLQIELSPGQLDDAPMAERPFQDLPQSISLLADRGQESGWIRSLIEHQDCTTIIPPQSNRIDIISFSKRSYRKRNLIERYINKHKQFRRIANRYDRKTAAYLAFATSASIRHWLRLCESAA